VIQHLQRSIRAVETGQAFSANDQDAPSSSITNGLAAMDRLLPEQGYRRGSLVEWLVPGDNTAGHGAELLSLQIAQRAAAEGGSIVVVDPAEEFHVPAARALGVELHRLVILRGRNVEDLYWSIDQALRCEAVAAVWAAASPVVPRFLTDMDERWQRRFQLSAEAGGGIGLFLRPERVARQPTWCDVQWRVLATSRGQEQPWMVPDLLPGQQLPENYWQRPISLQLLRCRGGSAGQSVHFNLDTRSGKLTVDVTRRRAGTRAAAGRHVAEHTRKPAPRHTA
jgi:hypothetical protein